MIAQAVEEEAEFVFDKTFSVDINNVAESVQYPFFTTAAPTRDTVNIEFHTFFTLSTFDILQYKLLYTIFNNIEVYEEPIPRQTKSAVQLNARPVRRIELYMKVRTVFGC